MDRNPHFVVGNERVEIGAYTFTAFGAPCYSAVLRDTSKQASGFLSGLQMNKIQKLVYVTLRGEVIEALAKDLSVRVTTEELMLALVKQIGKSLEEVAELDLTYESIKSFYEQSEEYKSQPRVLALIEFEESIIPEGTEQSILDELVKHKGEVWVVHRNDADPHPSDPHAHNYEANLKLHLGTGDLYMKRRVVGKIAKKALLAIREKISGIPLPALSA